MFRIRTNTESAVVRPGGVRGSQAEAKYGEALAVKGEHVDTLQYLASLEMERAKLAAGLNVGARCAGAPPPPPPPPPPPHYGAHLHVPYHVLEFTGSGTSIESSHTLHYFKSCTDIVMAQMYIFHRNIIERSPSPRSC